MKIMIFLLFSILALGQNSSFIYELNYKPNSDSVKTEKNIYFFGVKKWKCLSKFLKFRIFYSKKISYPIKNSLFFNIINSSSFILFPTDVYGVFAKILFWHFCSPQFYLCAK